jgi:hypothetical protein
MKTFTILLISIFSFAALTTTTTLQAQPGFSGSVDFNTFYQQLSPYGQWLNVPRYGRVWSYNEPGFRPYATNGQWEDTDEGWYWNSDYAWGAIPFHYGRWEQDPYYGWIWIPGYDYAPAWVVWSQAGDCYGWAPLGFGLDINVSFGRIPSNRWMYASVGNITRPRIDRYCVPYGRNDYYYGRQQPIVNIYTQRNVRYMAGPRRDNHYGNNRFDSPRPPVRNDQYGNRGRFDNNNQNQRRNDYSENQRRPDNNIHYDPSQYNRDRAIAGGRPQMNQDNRGREQNARPEMRPQESRPQMNQDNRGRGQNTRPEMRPQEPRPQMNQGQRPQMTQPRVNEQPRMQPQRNEGSRPTGGRDRRIF